MPPISTQESGRSYPANRGGRLVTTYHTTCCRNSEKYNISSTTAADSWFIYTTSRSASYMYVYEGAETVGNTMGFLILVDTKD
jgi:hypothetical protein